MSKDGGDTKAEGRRGGWISYLLLGAAALLLIWNLIGSRGGLDVGTAAPKLKLSVVHSEKKLEKVSLKYGERPTVLIFWATYCGPCLASLPDDVALARRYRGKADVFAINQDGMGRKELKEWLNRKGIAPVLTVLEDDGQAAAGFRVSSIPAVVVVDRKGKVAGTYWGRSAVNNAANLLGKMLDG